MITIFTPTYNRLPRLKELYRSLQGQTCFDFEWIIVDDGSVDGTFEYILTHFINDLFQVKCFRQENSGKHIAINRGVAHASGNLFFIVDSDDLLTPDAVAFIQRAASQLPSNGKWGGIAGLRVYPDGRPIGTSFVGEFLDCPSLERWKHRIQGDKAEVFFTDVLKCFPFPQTPEEHFCPEALVWNRIAAAGYQLRWFNKPIYVCRYLPDGLTSHIRKHLAESLQNFAAYTKELIGYDLPLKLKLRALVSFSQACHERHVQRTQIAQWLGVGMIPSAIVQKLYVIYLLCKLFTR